MITFARDLLRALRASIEQDMCQERLRTLMARDIRDLPHRERHEWARELARTARELELAIKAERGKPLRNGR